MMLDLRDPQSIARWYRCHPGRHGPQLAGMAVLWPEFAPAIAEAGRLLREAAAAPGAQPTPAAEPAATSSP
jgi:hypothetical protein